MATLKMSESIPCKFEIAWVGECNQPTDNGWCSKHENKICISCGKKAVGECDNTGGSFVCGAPLCKDCCHTPYGDGHITKEVAEVIYKNRKKEEEEKIASRANPAQRMNKELGIPLNLLELLKGDLLDFEIKKYYYLELEHELMGCFPAIFSGTDEIVITTDLEILSDVWKTLPPKRSKISFNYGYVSKSKNFAYPILGESEYDRETSNPFRLLTSQVDISTMSFCWAFGLLNLGSDPNKESFLNMIDIAIKKAIQ